MRKNFGEMSSIYEVHRSESKKGVGEIGMSGNHSINFIFVLEPYLTQLCLYSQFCTQGSLLLLLGK